MLPAALSALLLCVALTSVGGSGAAAASGWVGGWAASPEAAGTLPGHTCPSGGGLTNQTVRNVVSTSVGGAAVRIRVSNKFGAQPLHVGRLTVGAAGTGATLLAGTMQVASFGGAPDVIVAPHNEVLSDPVPMAVRAQERLAVSVFLPSATGPITQHFLAEQTNYVSTPGNYVFTGSAQNFTTPVTCWLFVDGLDVQAGPQLAGTVVALGDSLTDGANSTAGADQRWPDALARRLGALPGPTLAVVNQGLAGNQLLADGTPSLFGQSALNRLNRDVLNQPGVSAVILLEGINDIGAGATPQQIITADEAIIARAHAQGTRVIGGTLTPFMGSNPGFGGAFGTPAGEAARQSVNTWIRSSGEFDGVADFDAAVADPAAPAQLLPAYDSGDHLHPDDAGYAAMAGAVDLTQLFRPSS